MTSVEDSTELGLCWPHFGRSQELTRAPQPPIVQLLLLFIHTVATRSDRQPWPTRGKREGPVS